MLPVDDVIELESESEYLVESVKLKPSINFGIEENLYILNTTAMQCSDALDECSDTMVSLEEICEQIEQCLTDETLSESSVKVINTTLMHLGNSIGLEMHIDPTLEDYAISTTGGSIGQSRISAIPKTDHIAKIKGYIVKIWNAIKALVVKWMASLKSYYTVFIANYKIFLAQVRRLKYIMADKKPIKTDGKVSLPMVTYNNLTTSGQFKNITEELEKLSTRAKQLGKTSDLAEVIVGQWYYLSKLPFSGAKMKAEGDPNRFAKAVINCIVDSNKGAMVYKKEGDNVFTYTDRAPYIGELKAVVKLTSSGDGMTISPTVTSIRDIPDTDKDSIEVDALEHNVLMDSLESIIFVINNVSSIAVDTTNKLNAINRCVALADALSVALDKANDEVRASPEYKMSKKLILDFTNLSKCLLEPCLTYQKQSIASSKALYSYCLKSISVNYKTTSATAVT